MEPNPRAYEIFTYINEHDKLSLKLCRCNFISRKNFFRPYRAIAISATYKGNATLLLQLKFLKNIKQVKVKLGKVNQPKHFFQGLKLPCRKTFQGDYKLWRKNKKKHCRTSPGLQFKEFSLTIQKKLDLE